MSKTFQWSGCSASFFTILTALLYYENVRVLRAFNEAQYFRIAAGYCAIIAVISSVLCLVSASFDYIRVRKIKLRH